MTHWVDFNASTVGINWENVKTLVLFPNDVRNEQHHIIVNSGDRPIGSDGNPYPDVQSFSSNNSIRDYFGDTSGVITVNYPHFFAYGGYTIHQYYTNTSETFYPETGVWRYSYTSHFEWVKDDTTQIRKLGNRFDVNGGYIDVNVGIEDNHPFPFQADHDRPLSVVMGSQIGDYEEAGFRLNGTNHADILKMTDIVDEIYGLDGDDIIVGRGGSDKIHVGNNDGFDQVVYEKLSDLGDGLEQVFGLSDGDQIDFSAVQGLKYIQEVAFTESAGEYRFDRRNGLVEFDMDGDAVADKQLLLSFHGSNQYVLNPALNETSVGSNILKVGAPAPVVIGPTINTVSIPNAAMKVGDVVTAMISVAASADIYTLVSGSINGYSLNNLVRLSDTHYTATFTIADGVGSRAASENLAVNLVLADSNGNPSVVYHSPIVLSNDAIDAKRPTLASATVNGSTVVLTYDEALNDLQTPLYHHFWVEVNGVMVSVNDNSVDVDGPAKTVTMTLATAVSAGQVVTLSYINDRIKDVNGNAAVHLNATAVTNQTGASPGGNPGGGTPGGGTTGGGTSAPTPPPAAVFVEDMNILKSLILGLSGEAKDLAELDKRFKNGEITIDQVVNELIELAQHTTIPSLIVSTLLTGETPSQEHLAELAKFAEEQLRAYTDKKVMQPALGPYEALGLGFSETTQFDNRYGKLTSPDFIQTAFTDIFARQATAEQAAHFDAQMKFFITLYLSNEQTFGDAVQHAKGAVIGQMIGHAMLDEPQQHRYDEAVTDFLKDAAKGVAVFGEAFSFM